VLVWPGGAEPRLESDVEVARVDSAAALDAFKDVYVRGWQAEAWLAPILQSYITRWLDTPGWTLYLASDQHLPIAAGILFEYCHVAYLADAATVPEQRSHGAQRALIARRIADARQNGASLVFSRADLGSSSQRNLERGGLAARYRAELWTRTPGA
jgi:GNAT superfamily N-acetyltransferase